MKRFDFTERRLYRASRGRALPTSLLATSIITGLLVGCGSHEPTGQVVAVVNGQEITVQDLQAEARGVKSNGDPRSLLPVVVARTLLAQGAHRQNLDRYPGFPSDVTRLKQDYLADKMLAATIRPAPPPSDADVRSFMDSHPLLFADRQALRVSLVKLQAKDQQEVRNLDTLDATVARLKALNIPFERNEASLDTASLPPELSQKLVVQSLGSFFTIENGGTFIAGVVNSRTPISVPPMEQIALARGSLAKFNTTRRVAEEVTELKRTANIRYQTGYAPITPRTQRSAAVAPLSAR